MSSEQQAGPATRPDQYYEPGPACPKCERGTRCLTSIFDVRRERSVLIYRCDSCREDVWI
ncbi:MULTISPECIES: hypothetical protein [Bradyrhizobium]|jgi:hypothetical protein|uniref:Uncharacterized protein n=1 Tax=Bradyrhizobium canariense TaxID=255045 RepID=A0A1X3GV09_9BRAD|nr:hypothetical protein [Bradyrhizobium canariense]MBM7484187.1 hypothetical protein [Bradyrhizobium canariense]OSI24540.1 hypothetical protein BST65_18600 [Bradyrhizobium canariense]OSI29830.1 hypothetical protein BST66_26110 [Bradyrhizobium canariense]OSI40950.1 hypothetical protein BSZ20_24470 [Bradyrhizobium canariense]OSI49506.1 hypothetical protein BST67_16855 [Bradyrhizobium canariense]